MSDFTIDELKKRLDTNQYKNPGGARKAVGKAKGWSEKEREAGRKVINAHFGVQEGESKPVKAKKTAASKKATRKIAALAAPKAKRGPKPKAEKRGRKPGVAVAAAQDQSPQLDGLSAEEIRKNPAAAARLGHSLMESISRGTSAIKDLATLEGANKDETKKAINGSLAALNKAVAVLQNVMVTALAPDTNNGVGVDRSITVVGGTVKTEESAEESEAS